ncbi:MAG: sigma-54-dependent transcriptional regulator [Kiritimatiellia bacterium]
MKPKILIVDDEKPTRDVMARILGASYTCLTAPDATQAMNILAAQPDVALILTDYKMPGENGVELIRKAKASYPALSAILITAFGEIDLAVEAMRHGADDFLTKPITDLGRLERHVANAIARNALERKIESHGTPPAKAGAIGAFIGTSPAMEKVYARIRKVAPTDAAVLIQGPSGSGKELTAHAIHDHSRRAGGPFVAVECASLPSTLLETELFGAVKGAYTEAVDRAGCFETANGGTLFLDEIGEIDANVQVKLLRVLETHTFQRVGETKDRTSDFRLVTATNRNLARLVAEGTFREDLYYRLNVIDIHTPALREHREDIPALVKKFIREYAEKNGGVVKGIADDALAVLEAYNWPGNVRQLRNAIEKMVVLAGGETLTVEDVPEEIRENPPETTPLPTAGLPASSPVLSPAPAPSSRASLAETEKEQILATLAACGGNKTQAAIQLGISRRTLHRKLNEWNLS